MGTWLIIAGIGCVAWWLSQRRKPTPSQTQSFTHAQLEQVPPPRQMLPLTDPGIFSREERGKSKVRWISPGEQVQIAGVKINGGLVYVGSVANNWDYQYRRQTAHIINPALSAAAFAGDVTAASMSYWPHYGEISPAARRAYLQWHATGRRDPRFGIGHIFLFFYGLEHRLFVEKSLSDARVIEQEVRELVAVYGSNQSFRGYARKFLAAVHVLKFEGPISPELSSDLLQTYELPADFRLGLSRRLNDGRISGDWLLAWYLQSPEKSLRTPAKRCFEEFKSLFLLRFAAQYPTGLRVKKSVKKLKIEYQLASGAGTVDLPTNSDDLSEPGGLTAPIKVAAALAAECCEALDNYSRFVGKYPTIVKGVGARMLLPDELKTALSEHAGYDDVKQAIESLLQHEVQPVSLSYLLQLAGLDFEKAGRTSSANGVQLIELLEHMHVGLEPDVRFGMKLPGKESDVVIFRLRGGVQESIKSTHLIAARILVDISVFASSIEGNDVQAGLQSALSEISRFPNLTRDEYMRVFAYFVYLSKAGNKSANWQRLASRPAQERERIAHVALCALTADGRLEAQEIRFAEKLYETLGLPKQRLYSDLHARTGDEPQTIKEADPHTGSVPIPPKPVAYNSKKLPTARDNEDKDRKASKASGPVFVDKELLERTRRDTADVQQLLNQIYSVPEEDTEAEEPSVRPDVAQQFHGLDRGHESILALFLEHGGSIGRSLFESETSRLGLFAAGALDRINEWSFGHFEEPLIEDGEQMFVAPHLITQLKQMQAGT